jgi:hypothetical protein
MRLIVRLILRFSERIEHGLTFSISLLRAAILESRATKTCDRFCCRSTYRKGTRGPIVKVGLVCRSLVSSVLIFLDFSEALVSVEATMSQLRRLLEIMSSRSSISWFGSAYFSARLSSRRASEREKEAGTSGSLFLLRERCRRKMQFRKRVHYLMRVIRHLEFGFGPVSH